MQKLSKKATRDKRNECDVFLVSLYFDEELETIQTYFGSKFYTQFKEFITEITDVTQ